METPQAWHPGFTITEEAFLAAEQRMFSSTRKDTTMAMKQPYMMVTATEVYYANPQGAKFVYNAQDGWDRIDAFPEDAVEAGTADVLPDIPDDIAEARR